MSKIPTLSLPPIPTTFSLASTDAECNRDIVAIQNGYSVIKDRETKTIMVGSSQWDEAKASISLAAKVGTDDVNVGLDIKSSHEHTNFNQHQEVTRTETNNDSIVTPGGERRAAPSSHPTRTTTTSSSS